MTIIYNKRTGNIKGVYSGNLQTIDSLFGGEAEDFKLIWNQLITDDDQVVINSPQLFRVNPETVQLELQINQNKYPIASTQ